LHATKSRTTHDVCSTDLSLKTAAEFLDLSGVFLFTAQFLGQTSGVRGSSLRILVSSTQLVQLVLEVDLWLYKKT
jgi:hypothetical protein